MLLVILVGKAGQEYDLSKAPMYSTNSPFNQLGHDFISTLSITSLSIECLYAECHYADCHGAVSIVQNDFGANGL
jgi:hypothetical protein